MLEALGTHAEKDEAWIVRAEAARSLGGRARVHPHKGYALAVLSRALGDADAAVVQSAAIGLAKLGEPRGVPALIHALEDAAALGKVTGVDGIQAALRSLTGIEHDQNPSEWKSWWKEHEAEVTKARPKPGPPASGS